jgi:type IV pilus assembly protein PilV
MMRWICRKYSQARSRGPQDGFTLVEVLVALIVLSIGMLGIAAMYVESLRASRSAILRTQAVALASDLADRIRANRAAGSTYTEAAPAAPCPAGVSATTIAQRDLCEWQVAIDQALPGANGDVVRENATATAPATYTVRVTWEESGVTASYQVRFQV